MSSHENGFHKRQDYAPSHAPTEVLTESGHKPGNRQRFEDDPPVEVKKGHAHRELKRPAIPHMMAALHVTIQNFARAPVGKVSDLPANIQTAMTPNTSNIFGLSDALPATPDQDDSEMLLAPIEIARADYRAPKLPLNLVRLGVGREMKKSAFARPRILTPTAYPFVRGLPAVNWRLAYRP